MNKPLKKIVVAGGGFAGVNLVMQLQNKTTFDITLVDKNNYNFFPPLLYQVATGFLEPSSISYPFRRFLRGRNNIHFRMGELIKVLPSENKILLSTGELEYDCLVIATGAETNFFGIDAVKHNAIPMKTMSDALHMRNTLLARLEEASRTRDMERMQKLLTIVVAGAGPTGVELSGMFAEMRKNIILKDYPEFAGTTTSAIYLIDTAEAVLRPMSQKAQKYSYDTLKKMGVVIRLGTGVRNFENDMVTLSDGTSIATTNLIWTAGVTSKVFEGIPQEVYGRGRRMQVDEFNKINGFENIYAVGDTCIQTSDPSFPNGHPQLAQVAIQQAKNLGKNFLLPSDSWKPFLYNDKGSMAIIGRYKAVADISRPKLFFNGIIAWFVWLFIHVISLLSFHNKLRTLYNWMVAYFTRDQHYRMILRPGDQQPEDINHL
ncbi:MAG: NAD(P)/FAD-dependent oxidoreductase [Chitinophagaceae bacterium]|nr:NAD(P)/FAD-dependent oxidoreductase [Chitinophagaceae bacterium]